MKKIAILFFLVFMLGCPPPEEDLLDGNGDIEPNIFLSAIIKGADRLVETQNNDGGWEWENPDTDPETGKPSPSNTFGVTAQGLLDAYRISGKEEYLTACKKAYGGIQTNANSEDEDHPEIHRIRGPDITFLVELSEVTGDTGYAEFAKERYGSALGEFFISEEDKDTAKGFAQYIRDKRKDNYPALIAWDINLYIQGVLALDRYYAGQGLGFDLDAVAMADVISESMGEGETYDFDLSDQDQVDYWLSHTGAIEAFKTTDTHTERIEDSLQPDLVSSQQMDDSRFGIGTGASGLQTTAYAVMALLKVGKTDAAKRAVQYLQKSQTANGGWRGDGIEYAEVSSEAIQAIADSGLYQ